MPNKHEWDSYINRGEMLARRETQLWWLAIIVIACLAVTVCAIDIFGSTGFTWDNPLIAFNNRAIRITLILSVFLICAYFRDSVRRLRKSNSELLSNLREQTDVLQHRNIELSRLKDISDRLVGSLDVQSGLDLLLRTALDIVDAQNAMIVLSDEESGNLDKLSVKTANSSGSFIEPCIDESLAQWVAERNQPTLLNSGVATPHLKGHKACKVEVSMLLVPININGKVLGVLSVAGKLTGDDFTQHDLDVTCTLAGQVGLAIEKMHLYKRLQDQVVCLRNALHELKQAQAGLVQSEKLATIGQLAGGMAHEINNPLLTILGRAEMLLMDAKPGSAHIRDLEIIKSETERIGNLVKNLLSFSRAAKTGFLSMVDVNETIELTLELAATQTKSLNVQVINRLTQGLPLVYIEKGELQQVYTNIIMNAYQAMGEEDGKLIVETSQDNSGHIVTKIADTGPGIPPEHMSQIFEPFYTTKPDMEGTGLGLSVARSIVEKYGGDIEVQNRVGEGATFIIKLPVAEDETKELPEAA